MKYKIILVTGGAGFLGRHLIADLLEAGFVVRCFDRVKPEWITKDIDFIEGDFTASHILAPAVKGADVVIHLVSTTLPKSSNEDPQFDAISNLSGTINLLDIAVKFKVKRLIFISSGGTVYGRPSSIPVAETHSTNPLCSYGIIKLAIEKYLRLYHCLYGLSSCTLRLSNLYGEYQRIDTGQGAIAVFCDKALKNETIDIWGDGAVTRDFLYVKDATEAIMKAIFSEYSGGEINIGTGYGTSLNQLISIIESVVKRKILFRYLPHRTFDIQEIYLDISEAKRQLQWSPSTPLRDGITQVVKWMQKHHAL